jgi:hypothetical protein
VSRPLCAFNLDRRHDGAASFQPIPVLYFTQLAAIAPGCAEGASGDLHAVDPARSCGGTARREAL